MKLCSIALAILGFFTIHASPAFAGPLEPAPGGPGALAVYEAGTFRVLQNFSQLSDKRCGQNGELPVPGSYLSGVSGRYAVYNPSFGLWRVCADSAELARYWGAPGDIPVAEDFNGDALTDYTVFRPATGEWFIQYSTGALAGGAVDVIQFGLPGDTPLAADFDGDSAADLAAVRTDSLTGGLVWYLRLSSGGIQNPLAFGLAGDVPLADDFDGDARAEAAVWRPTDGAWYILSAGGSSYTRTQFGLPGDVPSASDVDGDLLADLAVYRPAESRWYVRKSTDLQVHTAALGSTGARAANHSRTVTTDRRAALDLNGDRITDLGVVRRDSTNRLRFLLATGTPAVHPSASILLGSAPASVVHGDYDGDGRSDFGAVYPEDGYLVWRFLRSGDQSLRRTELLVTYGLQGDQVLNADFDADRITDLAVVRNMPSGLKLWLPNNSGNQPLEPVSWGFNSDTALTADIDGDGKSDYIVVRQLGNELMWLVRTARGEALPVRMYGFVGDELAPGDYNGDGRAELAVIRIISGGKLVIPDGLAPFYWGLAGDTSLTGHYAGTQQVSCAVFRMFNGQGFFYLRSGIAGAAAIALGAAGDIALNPLGTTRVEGSGSSSGGPTAPRLNCAARSSVSAQEDGFLWQPQAADGKLLVRFGVSRAGMVARVGLIDSGESQDVLLETLASAGLDGSGRPIYRGAAAGASYPAGVILVRQDLSGNNNCIDVALPGQQYGSL